jgi:hypothetical protein
MCGEDGIAAGPGKGAAAGEDANHITIAADPVAIDGEVLAPARAVRRHLSNSEEDALGEQVRAEHEAGEKSLKEAVAHFRKCGAMLLKLKAELRHGHFQCFLKVTAKLSPRTAQRYMMLARELAKLPRAEATRVSRLSLRDALGELSRLSRNAARLGHPALSCALNEARHEPIKNTIKRAAHDQAIPSQTDPSEKSCIGHAPPAPQAREPLRPDLATSQYDLLDRPTSCSGPDEVGGDTAPDLKVFNSLVQALWADIAAHVDRHLELTEAHVQQALAVTSELLRKHWAEKVHEEADP